MRVDEGGKRLKSESGSPAGSRGQALRGQGASRRMANGEVEKAGVVIDYGLLMIDY